MKPSNKPPAFRLLRAGLVGCAGLLVLAGCATVQPTAFPIGHQIFPPKASSAPVALFKDSLPDRKYEPVARLNVHVEKTFFIPSAFEEVRTQLEDLARQKGADAIIEIVEKKSRLNETFIYNVAGVAIVYTD